MNICIACCYLFTLLCEVSHGQINYPLNPEPAVPFGTNTADGLISEKQTAEQRSVKLLRSYIQAYSADHKGVQLTDLTEFDHSLGAHEFKSSGRWESIKRQFTFVNVEGHIEDSFDIGPFNGKIILIALSPITQRNSKEPGRYMVIQRGDAFLDIWVTESQLRSFSKWSEVAAKLEAVKALVAKMPPIPSQSPINITSGAMNGTPTAPVSVDSQTQPLPAGKGASWFAWAIGIVTVAAFAFRSWFKTRNEPHSK